MGCKRLATAAATKRHIAIAVAAFAMPCGKQRLRRKTGGLSEIFMRLLPQSLITEHVNGGHGKRFGAINHGRIAAR